MNKYRKKTMATLLIAVFMISMFAVAYATTGTYLVAEGDPAGNEDMIEIDMPDGFTLGDLNTISWSVFAEYGWPPHVDITLGTNDPDQSMLTAEIAYNNLAGIEWDDGLTYTYDGWLETFELTSGDGFDEINNGTMFWVTKMGAGNDDAPSSTLGNWKLGLIDLDPHNELVSTEINALTPVLMLEIEVDNWVENAAAYVDNIQVNGDSVDLLVEVLSPYIVSITVDPTSVNFGALRPGETAEAQVTIYNIGDVAVTIGHTIEGDFFMTNLVVTDPVDDIVSGGQDTADLDLTVPSGTPADIYTGKLVFEATPVPP